MPKKILVVEDFAELSAILKLILEDEGFNVITAGDGVEALSLALIDEPDLILIDISLPRFGGLDLISYLRKDSKLNGMPVVAMTALEDRVVREALVLGANKAMLKPFELDLLLNNLTSLLA